MGTIFTREFIDSFKSIRSILIILFITFITYQASNILSDNEAFIRGLLSEGMTVESAFTSIILFIMFIFGFLFVFSISHDVINKEIELKTIRLLVTKVSRLHIMLGKLLGVLAFWIVVITLSFVIASLFSDVFDWKTYVQTIIFLFYITSFVLFISTIITSTKLTMFLGIFIGIMMPIIGIWSSLSEKWYALPLKYILPYNYVDGALWNMLIPLIIGIGYFIISVVIVQRRDI